MQSVKPVPGLALVAVWFLTVVMVLVLAFFADHGLAFTQFIGRDDFPVGTAQSSIDTLPLLSNIRPSAAHPLEAFWRLFRLGKTEISLQTALGV